MTKFSDNKFRKALLGHICKTFFQINGSISDQISNLGKGHFEPRDIFDSLALGEKTLHSSLQIFPDSFDFFDINKWEFQIVQLELFLLVDTPGVGFKF